MLEKNAHFKIVGYRVLYTTIRLRLFYCGIQFCFLIFYMSEAQPAELGETEREREREREREE